MGDCIGVLCDVGSHNRCKQVFQIEKLATDENLDLVTLQVAIRIFAALVGVVNNNHLGIDLRCSAQSRIFRVVDTGWWANQQKAHIRIRGLMEKSHQLQCLGSNRCLNWNHPISLWAALQRLFTW